MKYARDSVPPITNARIDKRNLKKLMGQGGLEMDKCVAQGKFPIFGYPLVCYSPVGN